MAIPSAGANLSWCSGADEWDENDNDTANGNLMNIDNAPSPNNAMQRYELKNNLFLILKINFPRLYHSTPVP